MTNDTISAGRALLRDLVACAKRAGATDAAATLHLSRAAAAGVRNGAIEQATLSSGFDIGLRVYIGAQSAVMYSTDARLNPQETAARAVETARFVPEDPHLAPADASLLAAENHALDIYDTPLPEASALITHALAAEEKALSYDGITNSEGAEAEAGTSLYALCRADGYENAYACASYGLSACVIAGEGDGMERDYAYSSAVTPGGLLSPEEIGIETAERTLRRMHACKPDTGSYTLIYEPRMARNLLGHLLGAINGASVARGASFFKDALHTAVFPSALNVHHAPMRADGLQSRPFDAEGVTARDMALVENGILQTFLLESRSAKKLNSVSNGCATGGLAPSPSAFNAFISGGTATIEDMIVSVEKGILVTDGFGGGVNPVTGDYSQGIAGILIENGKLTGAVNEMTAAGKLPEMFLRMHAAGDTEFRYASNAPALMIEGMAVAGR